MKKLSHTLFFIFAVFIAFAFFSCENSSSGNDDLYIQDDKKEEDKNPSVMPKPKAKIFVQSKSSHEICIYSDSERQNLVAYLPANASVVLETDQIGEAIFYYTFLISLDQNSDVKIPFHDNSCAFLLATSVDEEAAQTISFPKSIALSSCFVILKNDGEKAIQLMSENFVISPNKTEGTTSAIINPGKSACYEIQKKNFENLGAYSVRETLGTTIFPLKEKIAVFEECKIYTIVFDGNSIRLANAIGQEELVGMKAYTVTHRCERLDSEEYETRESETVYGFPEEMTEATPKEYEGFEAEDVEQQEIAGDGSTNIEIRYKRIRTTLIFNANGGTFGDGSETKMLQGKYGAEVEMPMPSLDDHRFPGYDAEIPRTFGVEDMAFNAEWEFSSTKETTDSSVYDVITSCKNPLYTYTIKLKDYITESTLQKVAKALYSNSTVSFVLDMSEAFGITELPSYSFNHETIGYQPCTNLFGILLNDEIKVIKENAFCNCTGLKSIEMPGNMTSIGNNAFNGCISLASVTIPSSVTSIGSSVFRDCTKLEGVTIPNSVKKLCGITVSVDGTNVKISNSVHTIADRAFSGEFDKHYNITSVTIPSSVTSMGNYAFENCTSLASIIIPGSVTEIGFDAFSGCASLVRVTLPNTITNISSGMFQDCTSLESIVIPKSVDDIIYSRAFKGCTNLKNLILEGKATLCDEVFFGCTNLKNVTLKSKTPPMILYAGQGKYPFEDNIIARIYVPAESVEEYKASKYWVHYKDKIFAIEEE